MESLVKNEFQLYSNLAKPLILNLPASKDRILAAAWVKKCADENVGTEQLRTTYLKMLLFCIQRRRLTGLFADDPERYEELEELPLGYDLNELAKNIIEQELDERRDKAIREISGDTEETVCYSTDCSPDLTEYVAAQDIPHFGVHVYYALSSKPINKWNKSEKAILPKGTRSAIETSITQGPTGGSASEPSCVCTPRGGKVKSDEPTGEGEDESNLPECKRKKKESVISLKRKKRPKKLGQSPPTHPIGEVQHVQEERVTPTWGTNLLDVREPTDIGKIDTPTEEELKLDEEVSRMLEAQDDDDETDEGADEFKDSTQDMLRIIDEWKHQKMDKPKRSSKSQSGLKKPSSMKQLKGMKKPTAKRPMNKKPDNLPKDRAGWAEQELQEDGLTDIKSDMSEPTNSDAMLGEADEDLPHVQTAYQIGVEADQNVIVRYDDQIDDFGDEFNISQAAEDMREGSPAIQSRIPVTTPGRAPTPRRVRSSERLFAEEGDFVFKRRTSPLAPIQLPLQEPQNTLLQHSIENEDIGERDPEMVQIFEEAKSAVQNMDQYQEQSGGQSFSQSQSAPVTGSSQQERAPLGSPELDSIYFQSKFRRRKENVFDGSPVSEIASPPQLSDDESFQMYESFYRDQDSGSTPVRATSTPPPVASEQQSKLQCAQLEIKAWEQEMKLRQGSPEARKIINDAQGQLMSLGAAGASGLEDMEAPFPKQRQKKILPKPAFSPTTGSPLNVPSYDIQPDDLGISYDDILDIPPSPYEPRGYISPPAAEQGDLFSRLGAPEITADDFRRRQPQYFHSGLDIATDDSPPPPLVMEEQISEPVGGRGCVRPCRPVSGLSPVKERYFEEELYNSFEKIVDKGKRIDVRPMSPWRNESIYYTPEVDRTLSVEYPLTSPPPRPFVPGVSTPVTPPGQFPIQRPGGFETPHDYGQGILNVSPPQFDMLPDYYTPGQRTPTESRRIPDVSQVDRAPCPGAVQDSCRKVVSPRRSRRPLGASAAVGEDRHEEFQTPRRQVGVSRRRLFQGSRTTGQNDLSPHWTPEGVAGPSRRPTGMTPPFYNSDFESPPPAPVPVQRFPAAKRIKKRGKYPPPPEPESPLPDIQQFSFQWDDEIQAQQNTNLPDYDDIRFRTNYRFCNDNICDSPPALETGSPLQLSGQDTFEMYESFYRDQDSGSVPRPGASTPSPPVEDRDQQLQRAQLELKAWEQEMQLGQSSPVASETLRSDTSAPSKFIPGVTSPATPPCQFPVQRPDSFATPDYGDGILNVTPPLFNISGEQSPCQSGAGARRQMSPALSLHWTPEGVAGPSRRPTGLTSPYYNSDFESPPPATVCVQRFPAAKKIKKRGKYPPSPGLPLPEIPQFSLEWENELRAEQQRQINENIGDASFVSRYEDEPFSFNETPPDLQEFDDLIGQVSPCPSARPVTPPRYLSIRTPPSVPSGSPRTPPLPCAPSQVTAPSVVQRGAGARNIPVRKAKPNIYLTRSQILRMKKMEQQKKAAQTISPVSKRLQENRARLAQIDEERRQAAAKRQAQPSRKRSIPRLRGTSSSTKTSCGTSCQLPQSTPRPVPVRPSGKRPSSVGRVGQVRQIMRSKDKASPCGTYPAQQDEYGGILNELGLTTDEVASAFNTDFLQDMEGEFEPDLSNDEEQIEILENRLSEIDSFIASHDELMRQFESELGLSPQKPYSPTTPGRQCPRSAKRKTPAKKKLTEKEQKMLNELKAIEERLEQIEPTVETQEEEEEEGVDEVERRVIQREREEREYFEKLFRGEIVEEPPSPYSEEPAQLSFEGQDQICPGAGASSVQYDAEEQELAEFEQLEREMADHQGQVCPGAAALPDDTPDQTALRTRLLQQEMSIQGPPRTGLQYPAQGITYSPRRPMETFGHIRRNTPPRPIPTRPPTPCAAPFSPPQDNILTMFDLPMLERLQDITPPFSDSLNEEMGRPEVLSPPLDPKTLRKNIRATADRQFHPAKRRDLSREDRRVMKGPPLSMYDLAERPTDAATSFMGMPYMRPSQRQKKKKLESIGRDIKFYKTDAGKKVMELERRHKLRRELVAPCSPLGGEEDHPLDEPVPRGLPQPLAPCYGSPFRRTEYTRFVDPFQRVEVPPLEFETFGQGGPPPLHPDLREVAQWEPPFNLGDTTAISSESYGEELMYSPEPLPGPEPLTPPSCGKGPCGTYSPTTSPPLGILESPDYRMYDPYDLQIFDEGLVDQPDVRKFYQRSPQPEPSTIIDADFDFFIETKTAKGRKGIKPKPQFFGGYGEKPKKYLPRWYGQRGPNLNIISEEGDIPPSPPVSSHGTPGPRDDSGLDEFLRFEQQFAKEEARRQNTLAFDEWSRQRIIADMAEQADRQLIMSPEQREFEMLEEQMSQEQRPGRITPGQRRISQFAERSRQAMIDEMAEEAERSWINRMRVPSPPQRVTSPCPVETFGPEFASRLDTSGIMDQSAVQYVSPPCSPATREEFEQFKPPISPRGIMDQSIGQYVSPPCSPATRDEFEQFTPPISPRGEFTSQLPEAGNFADLYQTDTRDLLEESFMEAESPAQLSVPSYDYQGAEQMVLGDVSGFSDISGISAVGMLEEESFPQLSPGRRQPVLERYIENMQRQQEARRVEEEASQQRRFQRYRQAMEELYLQNFPSPASPGPDANFLANVYSHHVSPSFIQGERSYMCGGMPRRAPAPCLGTITEPRVRIESPKPTPKRPKHKHGKQIIPPAPRPGRTSSARRVEEARKLYKEISRHSEVRPSAGPSMSQRAVPRHRGIGGGIQLSGQPPPLRPFTGFVPTQVADQSSVRSRMTQGQGAIPRLTGVGSNAQPPRPFTGFVPTQVRASSRGRSSCGGSSQGRSGCGPQCPQK